VEQVEGRGIAHAIHLVVEAGLRWTFRGLHGGQHICGSVAKYVEKFREKESDVYTQLSKVKDSGRFGVAILRDEKISEASGKAQVAYLRHAVAGFT